MKRAKKHLKYYQIYNELKNREGIQEELQLCLSRADYARNQQNPSEECGVFGIYGHKYAANLAYLGLYALQHRGQESAGIASTNGENLYRYAGMGQVATVFNEDKLKELEGFAAIGHNRYSTTGASLYRNAQPLRAYTHLGAIAIAHNGNLTNTNTIRTRLEKEGSIFQTTMDSEVIVHLLARSKGKNMEEAFVDAIQQVKGAYSLVMLSNHCLIAMRDPHGFRPLVMGRVNGSTVFASETCALDIIDAEYIRDVEPGEMVIIQDGNLHSLYPFAEEEKKENYYGKSLCIFEHIYFARPDSYIFKESVYDFRFNLGKTLAKEQPVDADIVVPVPDSSVVAAIGFSQESGIPYATGLVRSHYIGRTFIEPEQKIRDFGAKIKYNVISAAIKDKRVVLVDDSIMRGTTSKKIIKMLKKGGAQEIHMRISAPPTKHPCYYGIDIPTSKELIAANLSVDEIRKYIGVDSLGYLSEKGMISASSRKINFCTACFNGKYPVPPEEGYDSKQRNLIKEMRVEES